MVLLSHSVLKVRSEISIFVISSLSNLLNGSQCLAYRLNPEFGCLGVNVLLTRHGQSK